MGTALLHVVLKYGFIHNHFNKQIGERIFAFAHPTFMGMDQ